MTIPNPIRSIRTVKKMTAKREREREAGMGAEEYSAATENSRKVAGWRKRRQTLGVPATARSTQVQEKTMRRFVLRTATIAGAIAVAACVENAPVSPTSNTITASTNSSSSLQLSALNNARSYIIDFTGDDLPADLSAQVAKAGGTLTSGIGQVGVAVASSDDPSFADRAGKIKGVFSVELDPMVQWVQPERVVEAGEAGPDVSVEPTASLGAAETFRRHRSSRSEEHTSELQSRPHLVCRLLLEKKKNTN